MNGEKPPVTKTINFLRLPNDLLLTCLARVSRLYYPTLSLVSKRFRSLIATRELYETRKLLGCTENCLYVGLRFPCELNPTRWFTLCRRPTQIDTPNPNPKSRKKEKKPSDKIMISVPTSYSNMYWWNIIAVGHNIYMIGGYVGGYVGEGYDNANVTRPSSEVFFMDCRSHTWHEAPRMGVDRESCRASVVDGKLYVVDMSQDLNPSNWIECFDPKTQIWEHVPSPDAEILRGSSVFQSLAMEGKLYLLGKLRQALIVAYKPEANRWDEVGLMEKGPLNWDPNSACVIDDVLYCYEAEKKLHWYDFEGRSWRILRKLYWKLPRGSNRVKLVDYGGKMAVLWEKYNVYDQEKKIWCAEVSLQRRRKKHDNIYGKVQWCDVVLTVHRSSSVFKLVATTV